MQSKPRHIELPRRLVAHYLFVALALIAWFGIGMVWIAQAVISGKIESGSLALLRAASSTLTIEYLRNGEVNLQSLVQRFRAQRPSAYCAVISQDNRYLAHSSPHLTGKSVIEREGRVVWRGDVQRIRYVEPEGRVVREYRVPLQADTHVIGTLALGVIEPTIGSTVRGAGNYAPLALLIPLSLVGMGAVVLHRMVRPLAGIDAQLRRAARATVTGGLTLQEVPVRGSVAAGWNRVVRQLATQPHEPLGERLNEAVQGFRQRRLDGVLNSLPDGVVVTDAEGTVVFANRAAVAVISPSQETLTGRSMDQCLRDRWALPEDCPLCDPQTQERSVVQEFDQTEADQRMVVRVSRHPIQSSDAAAAPGHVWTLRDITQQTLADEMRDQFVDSATHELRTPLANIKAHAETLVLTDQIDVEQQKQFLNTINAEATRLARFIDDLLSISSMEVGSLKLARQQTDVARLLQEVITWVTPQMEKKRLTFEQSLPEKIPEMNLDKDKITATLVNLLGNAAKYTPQRGRVALRVRVTEDQLEVDVQDSGVGIAPDELPRIFEKFFRSADPRVQAESGTGLGLSLAHEVIRLHGGNLTVQSELNKGSTFTISLPLS